MLNTVDPLLVPVSDGAKLLGIGRSKFYTLISEGKIPLAKIGRKSLVPVAALRRYAASLSGEACSP